MDPNRNENFSHLIARRPERLNILVTQTINERSCHGGHEVIGNVVGVRYGYTGVSVGRDDDDLRPAGVFVDGHSDWSPTALNQINQPGAFFSVPDVQGIRDAVAMLRETWGPLHVQDNSGLVPDLHQGAFQG